MSNQKNRKRIQKNIKFIEEYVESLILGAENTYLLDLYHSDPISLCESKRKISSFLEKIRQNVQVSEYLMLSHMDNMIPTHKVLLAVPSAPDQIQKFWLDDSELHEIRKEDSFKTAIFLGEFYEEAALSLPHTYQNSKSVKSKLFHRSIRKAINTPASQEINY